MSLVSDVISIVKERVEGAVVGSKAALENVLSVVEKPAADELIAELTPLVEKLWQEALAAIEAYAAKEIEQAAQPKS